MKYNTEISKDKREVNVKVYCKKIKGKVRVTYIDEETFEVISEATIDNIPLSDNAEIDIADIEGYELVEVVNEETKDLREDEHNKTIEDIRNFIKDNE